MRKESKMKKAISKARKNWKPEDEKISLDILHAVNIKDLYFKQDQLFIIELVQDLKKDIELYNYLCFDFEVLRCLELEIEIDVKIEILNDFFRFARQEQERMINAS